MNMKNQITYLTLINLGMNVCMPVSDSGVSVLNGTTKTTCSYSSVLCVDVIKMYFVFISI